MEESTVGFNTSLEIGFLFHYMYNLAKKDEAPTVANASTNQELIQIRCRHQLDAYEGSQAMKMMDKGEFNIH